MPYRVRDPEAMALLRDPARWRLFTPFIKSESGAAKRVGVPNVQLVQKGLRLGLLTPTRVETRKGRPIRFYRAGSEQFFVAYEDMTATSLEDDLLEGWHHWERRVYASVAKHFEGGLRAHRSERVWPLGAALRRGGRRRVPTTHPGVGKRIR